MKRILTIVAFIFSFMFVMAQTPNKHLTFKGIPITGTVESFAQKLEAKGLKKVYSDKEGVMLKGEFAGYSGCNIYVNKVPNRNIVYNVNVCLPDESSWVNLAVEYNKFKYMLTNKYGEPISCSETFKEGAPTFSDAAKMRSLKEGNCYYGTIWEVDNGTITVQISSISETDGGYIRLGYYDEINRALAQKATEDDL